jgi:vitamin B12 transporter
MVKALRRPVAAAVLSCASAALAHAQSPGPPAPGTPDFVVTATRTPQAIERAGSAITVITADEIAKESPKNIVDALRRAPGLSVVEAGGPGGTTTVRIRGAEAGQTLVLIDGVRVNDPASASNEFDFAQLVPTDIERIEVLRGPQSALYGSDAMGGVINVITRKGRGAPRANVSAEAGSYGSKGGRASVSGSHEALSYAFSLTGYDTAGFSRYGYRIGRIERSRAWPLEADSAKRLGASGRVGLTLSETMELEFGGYASRNRVEYDAAFGEYPDTPSKADQDLVQGYSRLTALAFDGLLRNTVLVAANRTDRLYDGTFYFGQPLTTSQSRDRFRGDRLTAEYQGDLKLGSFGLLTFGTAIERDRVLTSSQVLQPVAGPPLETADASRSTRSAFVSHQVSLWQNLHVSIGGRIDDVEDADRFATWRATAAYEIPESNTKVRASIGTGAKAPSLFQLFDPVYGTPGLTSERSFGIDAGVDQRLFDDRLVLSATVFANRFRDLIDFSFDPAECPPANTFGCYLNVARARTSGIELSGDLDVIPSWLRVKIAYTHLDAIDLLTGDRLARRPRDEGRLGFILTPLPGLSIEPTIVLVGERFSTAGERDRLAPYARLDLYADYRISDTFSLFARAENLTGAEYQEVYDFGTAGRSFYGGLRATW